MFLTISKFSMLWIFSWWILLCDKFSHTVVDPWCVSTGIWFQGEHHQGTTTNAKDVEFNTLHLYHTYTVCTLGLSTHNLKPHGTDYITVTKLLFYTLILLTKSYILFHVLYLKYWRCLIHFYPNTTQLALKSCCLLTKQNFYFIT
jgi:hypothetical protein